MSDRALELWIAYCGPAYEESARESFKEAYQGEYGTLKDYAYELIEETQPELIKAIQDAGLHFEIDDIAWQQDYFEEEGHIFRTT